MKALKISYEIGSIELQFHGHLKHALNTLLLKGDQSEAVSNLFVCIEKCEEMRRFLRDNDRYKISFFDEHVFPYRLLSALFCATGKPNEALCAVELGRARALADMMSAQYLVKKQITVSQHSWGGIEKIMKKDGNCTCLYISYLNQTVFLWILKTNKTIVLRQKQLSECFSDVDATRHVDDVFKNKNFRNLHVLPQEQCEDRTLFPSSFSQLTRESTQEESLAVYRLVEVDKNQSQHPEPPTLAQCYNLIIAPVADLLDEPEITIVPDRCLYHIPFAAMIDQSGKYLSDSFRIRIVPSLTTLQLIQDSPADYHSQTGVLIVGEPAVRQVYPKELTKTLCPLPKRITPLPGARKEAEMIGRLLGAQPLLGENATKQAVLQSIHSVSLIHIAAHGDVERGEITLASPLSANEIPLEKDCLLTMAEISQVRLTAKLVVLSCCHSAQGQTRSEGVVGIARAFLGSGARSVLVALWAIQDEATEQFMSHFYQHLVRGDSASESLHQEMKWMRSNGFSDVGQWAPFLRDISFSKRKVSIFYSMAILFITHKIRIVAQFSTCYYYIK